MIFSLVAFAATLAASGPPHELHIVDRVSKFETFYQDATRTPISAGARFALWQKEDGIAAVPPGPQGQQMARELLDAAWPRYPSLVAKLPVMAETAQADAQASFTALNRLFADEETPIDTRLVLYVGQFDNNAYTIPAMNGNPPTVMMSVENANLRVELAHELAHSINFQLAHVKNSFGAPIGETMFLEGLAMHASKDIVPGMPDRRYTEMPGDTGWLAQCEARKGRILAGIRPYLNASGRDSAMRFTFGTGTTGMHREAYCAGWILVGSLLESGYDFPKLARIPETEMVPTIAAALDRFERK
ncbi:MAG TPA: DUF2268 domain-containing putative Zn-dependent protease [Candidatus Aquilonibacter sp.]|nr:DUF2268 domain-containing putative Zn-dependent protease [Candidatus Aquilonibacter sp.]